jgi:hypothetical protein
MMDDSALSCNRPQDMYRHRGEDFKLEVVA